MHKLLGRFCKLGSLLVVIALAVTPQDVYSLNTVMKSSTGYHSMCGCNTIVYQNSMDLNGEYNAFQMVAGAGTGTTNIIASTLTGSTSCNSILTSQDGYASLDFSDDFTSCFLSGKNSKLTGHFLTVAGDYVEVWAQYQLDVNPAVWIDMEKVHLVGLPYWKQFDYYFDFSSIPNVVHVRLLVTSPFDAATEASVPVEIDELTICQYCNGTLNPLPTLSNLSSPVGYFQNGFQPDVSQQTLLVPNGTTSFQLTPTISPQWAGSNILINGQTVVSGQQSVPLPVIFGGDNYVLVSENGTNCYKRYYDITVSPESPLPNASLTGLDVVGGTLQPAFSSPNLSYSLILNAGVSTVTLTPHTADLNAKIYIGSCVLSSGITRW